MENTMKMYITADEVAELLGVSRGYGNYTRAVSNVNARIVHCCKISDQRTEGST